MHCKARAWTRRIALAAALAAACGAGVENLSDAECTGTSLTYENFGRAYLAKNCLACHAGTDGTNAASHCSEGIPLGSLECVQRDRERIFRQAAGRNTSMPPGPSKPSEEDREKLATWLRCGAP